MRGELRGALLTAGETMAMVAPIAAEPVEQAERPVGGGVDRDRGRGGRERGRGMLRRAREQGVHAEAP